VGLRPTFWNSTICAATIRSLASVPVDQLLVATQRRHKASQSCSPCTAKSWLLTTCCTCSGVARPELPTRALVCQAGRTFCHATALPKTYAIVAMTNVPPRMITLFQAL
jgi:hypothetical protein